MSGDRPSTTASWLSLIGSLLGLAFLSWVLWRPLYGEPAALPDRIRAVEGDLFIPATRAHADEPYVLRTSDGRALALHCGPAAYRAPCLEEAGLEAGAVYRLTIAYGAQILEGGRVRNVITHAVFDDLDLVTPQEQAWAWSDRNAIDAFIRRAAHGRRSSGIHVMLGGAYLLLVAVFLQCAFALVERRI